MIRTATDPSLKKEILGMKEGEIVSFPFDKYNPTSVRNTPSQLIEQRGQGYEWITKADYHKRRVLVVRIS